MGKSILIVDDSDAARQSMQFRLKTKGYEVDSASNGQEGLDKLKSGKKVDLIITDMNMPVMNGVEMVREIRGMSEFKYTPIIVLSTDEDKGQQALKLGASGFIVKSSSSSEEVLKLMGRFIGD